MSIEQEHAITSLKLSYDNKLNVPARGIEKYHALKKRNNLCQNCSTTMAKIVFLISLHFRIWYVPPDCAAFSCLAC